MVTENKQILFSIRETIKAISFSHIACDSAVNWSRHTVYEYLPPEQGELRSNGHARSLAQSRTWIHSESIFFPFWLVWRQVTD